MSLGGWGRNMRRHNKRRVGALNCSTDYPRLACPRRWPRLSRPRIRRSGWFYKVATSVSAPLTVSSPPVMSDRAGRSLHDERTTAFTDPPRVRCRTAVRLLTAPTVYMCLPECLLSTISHQCPIAEMALSKLTSCPQTSCRSRISSPHHQSTVSRIPLCA